MACQEEEKSKTCFKGVEGFLRRVAFNLGNSPSQTEVKIISCIPIDVTDLQQKIIHLEKQLEEVNCTKKKSQAQCRVEVYSRCGSGVAVCDPPGAPSPAGSAGACDADCAPACSVDCAPACGPARSPVCAAACTLASPIPDMQGPSANCAQPLCPENFCRKSTVSFNIPDHQSKSSRGQQREPWSNATCNDVETRKRNLFKRHKKARKNSPLIYYAHTTTSPFNNYRKEVAARREMKRMDAAVRPSYDVLRKQYLPEVYFEEWTGDSQVSQPVCRDRARAPSRLACARDADACSCCRGCFYNLDLEHRPYHFLDESLATNMYQNVDSGNIYYNSSYYDIFPVKEKPDTYKRDNDKLKKCEPKIYFDNMTFQDNCRTKIECRPLLTNTKFSPTPRSIKKTTGKTANRKDHAPKQVLRTNESSRNTSVECGDIYIKRYGTKKRRAKQCNKTVLLKNVECLTHNVNDTECQTESSKNMRPEAADLPEESRPESTLDQIKSILQSVLSHVKTNNQIKVQADNKEKKDAIVQKELQNSSAACSRLLNSYTYSPFSMNPYMPSCSRAVPAGACAPVVMPPQAPATSSHYKYMQNFPVFIQHTPAHRQCSGCCHPRPEINRHPIQTSTNTLSTQEKHSKETENLIKEIYKSMALNIPIKRASNSDYTDQKLTNVSRIDSGEPMISNMMMMTRQVGSKAQSERVRPRAAAVSTATTSRATSSTRSALAGASDDTRSAQRAHAAVASRAARRAVYDSGPTASSVDPRPRRNPDVLVESDSPSEDDADSASASVSDSEDTVIPSKDTAKGPAKKGIFKKMFGSVFKRRRKIKHEERVSSAAESESDSDDYQTIYSQTVEKPKHVTYAPARVRSRPRRPLARGPRGPRGRARRSPYLEQEQRRYWDEQLMFQKPPPTLSSGRPASRPPGIYFRKYEARHALVDAPGPFRPAPNYEREFRQECDPAPRPRKSVSLKVSNKKISWLKRHTPKIKCGNQWKQLLLEG